MNYAEIKYMDVANGPGVRTSIFVSGCTHHCEDCFNQKAWDFNYGTPFTKDVEDEIMKTLRNGITFLGGEPFELVNLRALAPFVERIRNEKPDISIWFYSGYTWEELIARTGEVGELTKRILAVIDILVDGRFMKDKKNMMLQFRGSENQRIINVPESLAKDEIIMWEKLRR